MTDGRQRLALLFFSFMLRFLVPSSLRELDSLQRRANAQQSVSSRNTQESLTDQAITQSMTRQTGSGIFSKLKE
jgi:hypothetical protein